MLLKSEVDTNGLAVDTTPENSKIFWDDGFEPIVLEPSWRKEAHLPTTGHNGLCEMECLK